ncbi:hypothetical protein [Micromonospora sp. NPDC007230]|uniref:hypothetical protein n=1 Tax=Micromonospora sp. NPDC007230 TaxID=3364237 RepID=UPI0036B09C2E
MLVDEHDDLFSLTISLGNTVGGREDVRSVLPVLFERLVMSGELDLSIVLSMLLREEWRTWPGAQQDAIDWYLEAVWRSLLAFLAVPRVPVDRREDAGVHGTTTG